MQENDQPFEPWAGYYTIKYIGENCVSSEQEHFDAVFSKLEKIQQKVILSKIEKLEAQLEMLGDELSLFLAKDGR
mgnify:CR=1 FL=1